MVEDAPAKVNLTLSVLGRRPDGYHEIESLVVFADFGDRLHFVPGGPGGQCTLTTRGANAAHAGDGPDNLVLKAAGALAALSPSLVSGAFRLDKKLPVAAGLGGGSADAAAALRLIAQANGITREDPRLYAAARATGADVPVCLDPRTRVMRGIGEVLSPPLHLPPLPAVLVNSGVALATKAVFAGWKAPAQRAAVVDLTGDLAPTGRDQLLELLSAQSNDLEASAIALAPAVAKTLAALRALPGCGLARMSGSGATCFGLFASATAANAAAKALRSSYPSWWVRASVLGA